MWDLWKVPPPAPVLTALSAWTLYPVCGSRGEGWGLPLWFSVRGSLLERVSFVDHGILLWGVRAALELSAVRKDRRFWSMVSACILDVLILRWLASVFISFIGFGAGEGLGWVLVFVLPGNLVVQYVLLFYHKLYSSYVFLFKWENNTYFEILCGVGFTMSSFPDSKGRIIKFIIKRVTFEIHLSWQ